MISFCTLSYVIPTIVIYSNNYDLIKIRIICLPSYPVCRGKCWGHRKQGCCSLRPPGRPWPRSSPTQYRNKCWRSCRPSLPGRDECSVRWQCCICTHRYNRRWSGRPDERTCGWQRRILCLQHSRHRLNTSRVCTPCLPRKTPQQRSQCRQDIRYCFGTCTCQCSSIIRPRSRHPLCTRDSHTRS